MLTHELPLGILGSPEPGVFDILGDVARHFVADLHGEMAIPFLNNVIWPAHAFRALRGVLRGVGSESW